MATMIQSTGACYMKTDIEYFRQRQAIYHEFLRDNEQMQYWEDGMNFLEWGSRHEYLATQAEPQSSTPKEEHWTYGPPSLTSYTEVELPVIELPHNFSTMGNPTKSLPPLQENTIYIPASGYCASPYIMELIAMIVGKNGDWMKKITEETGVHYIWYNPNPCNFTDEDRPAWGCFQLWGAPDRLPIATKRLNQQMDHVLEKLRKKYR